MQAIGAGVLVAALLGAAPATAIAYTPDERDLIQEMTQANARNEDGRPSDCLDHLRRLEPLAARVGAAVRLAYMLIGVGCQAALDPSAYGATESDRAARLDTLLDPVLDQLALEDPEPEPSVAWMIRKFDAQRQVGALALGRQRLYAWVDERLARVVAGDALAQAQLRRLMDFFHGTWHRVEEHREIHARYRAVLGIDHPLTLLAQRRLAYVEGYLGYHERSKALTLEAWEHARANPAAAHLMPHLELDVGAALAGEDAPEALQHYQASLRLFSAAKGTDPVTLARVHTHLALLNMELGDFDAAIEHADQGQALVPRLDDGSSHPEASFIGAIGAAARMLRGDAGGAARLRVALTDCTPHEMHSGQLVALLALHAAQTQDAELLAWSQGFLDAYAARFRPPMHADRAVQAWLRHQRAQAGLEPAWALALPNGDGEASALVEFALARQAREGQALEAAIWHGKRGAQALARHGGDADADSSLPRGAAVRHEPELQALIGDLVQAGRLAEADQGLRLLHDEELQSYRRRSRGTAPAPRTALSMTEQESGWDRQLEPVTARLSELASESRRRFDAIGNGGPRQGYREADDLRQRLAAAQGELRPLVQPASTAGPKPLAADLTPIPTLPQGHVRLVLWPHQGRLHGLLQRAGRPVTALQWPVDERALAQAIQAHRQVLARAERDARPAGQALFQMLLAPLQGQLDGVQQVRLSPEGVLRYVNFAALHDGRRWAAERWTLVNELAPVRAAATPVRSWLAAGRSAGDAQHGALPAVELELDALQRLGAQTLRREAFSAAGLRSALEHHPDVVHLASHYRFDPVSESRSYLLLGSGEHLTLPEFRALPWAGVRIVVLSACESGVPMQASLDGHSGREWLGLADGLHRAGVPNVIATQWQVDDQASSELMAAFHQALARQHRADPETLARTQRQWLQRHAGQPLAHPHYWAGFTWFRA